jgi:hypothetical protein
MGVLGPLDALMFIRACDVGHFGIRDARGNYGRSLELTSFLTMKEGSYNTPVSSIQQGGMTLRTAVPAGVDERTRQLWSPGSEVDMAGWPDTIIPVWESC